MFALRRAAILIVWLAGSWPAAWAQSGASPFENSAPVVGGAGIKPPTTTRTFGPSAGNEILRHRDLAGKPCLAVEGYARGQTVNPNLYDHVIVATNNCPRRITIRVCYYQSQDCIPLDVEGDSRKETILGTMPAEKEFRFEFHEKF